MKCLHNTFINKTRFPAAPVVAGAKKSPIKGKYKAHKQARQHGIDPEEEVGYQDSPPVTLLEKIPAVPPQPICQPRPPVVAGSTAQQHPPGVAGAAAPARPRAKPKAAPQTLNQPPAIQGSPVVAAAPAPVPHPTPPGPASSDGTSWGGWSWNSWGGSTWDGDSNWDWGSTWDGDSNWDWDRNRNVDANLLMFYHQVGRLRERATPLSQHQEQQYSGDTQETATGRRWQQPPSGN